MQHLGQVHDINFVLYGRKLYTSDDTCAIRGFSAADFIHYDRPETTLQRGHSNNIQIDFKILFVNDARQQV